ncbi:hypothetical protein F07S3_29740 [Bradyrhizobium diazoefficiens]|uniref:DUF2783 domain-containing protein n=3 Tax=Nitrobacteraceae TaxID=41294 RepID=A0A810AQR0_9BRAD|nr:hypothetical protein F07S3_29740 [Bradyrhizobium diazoefficiens]BCE63961.1 hypothetical protein XF6B_27600 [Bradyrhizobium diazoefficiens]
MMRMSENEHRVVNDLVEEIMDELRGEPAAVQIKVAFAVLAKVISGAARHDPEELKRAAVELNQLMNAVQ